MQLATRGTANPLDAIEQDLRTAIFGQNRAIESVIRAMNRARYGFAAGNRNRPLVNLMFLGPTGVGKSECAKRLASRLHPEGGGFLKVDCSLFSQGHEVSALVGAPPSYVGRDQKPLLDPDIIETENSVLLFDEIEKGTSELWNLLLQIMEDGEVTLLNSGRTVSFRNTILIMTTNVGAKEMVDYLDKRNIGFRSTRQDMEATGQQIFQIGFEALQRHFRPEWINRIDEIIAFRPLSSATMSRIFDRMIDEANGQYINYGVKVDVSEAAKDHILRKGYNPTFGARPLRARLLKDLDAPLADLLASGGIPQGSRVLVAFNGNETFGEELSFYFQPDAELEAQGRKRRDTAAQTKKRATAPQESKSPPSSQGPAMAKSIDGSHRR
ncbi:MAG: ATP-dependent Clp protease ATP-binding subunit [Chloroflexi bacterium]|nr:MAG: ATP-dependent Clp protease ATP-binding subunit [Chloroflexota bacterium]